MFEETVQKDAEETNAESGIEEESVQTEDENTEKDLKKIKITEVPLKSVDRLFGGSSTFKPLPWIKEYLKWFFWGIKESRKLK